MTIYTTLHTIQNKKVINNYINIKSISACADIIYKAITDKKLYRYNYKKLETVMKQTQGCIYTVTIVGLCVCTYVPRWFTSLTVKFIVER